MISEKEFADAMSDLAAAEAEVDRLRAALKPLADIPLWRDTYPDANSDELFAAGRITIEHVRAARRALAGARSVIVALQGWQPIDSAPRNGRAVLVHRNIWPGTASGFSEECNGHNTYVAEWWAGEHGGGVWMCYMDRVSEPRCPIEPTHWMPLPDTP